MRLQQSIDTLAQQSELDSFYGLVQQAIKRAYSSAGPAGQVVEDAMHGTWLGHPLHPALSDVTIGSWAATSAFDLLGTLSGSRILSRCAAATLALGTLAALPTAISGLTDAQHPYGEARRVAITHGLLNIVATTLQAISLAQRATGRRGLGRFLSAVGYGTLLASAYLGGDMITKYRLGVNQAPPDGVPAKFVPVLPEAELPENVLRQVEVEGVPVLLVRRGGQIYAMHATCTHMAGNLAEGTLVDDSVQCPLHGSRFALEDGRVTRGPATYPERCLATRVRNGQIEVGPGAGLGRCGHEPVTAPAHERERAFATPSFR